MLLNAALVTRLNAPMWATWGEISSDFYELCSECGARATNAGAIEMVIDANRMTTLGKDKEADDMIGEAIKEHGYKKVDTFLKKNFKFV